MYNVFHLTYPHLDLIKAKTAFQTSGKVTHYIQMAELVILLPCVSDANFHPFPVSEQLHKVKHKKNINKDFI